MVLEVDWLSMLEQTIGDHDIKTLRETCNLVIAAIQRLNPKPSILLENFPHGSCGMASALLGLYLTEEGFGDFEYVSGRNDKDVTHAWLQQGDLIIDITACQFNSGFDRTVITKDHSWHSNFKPDSFCPCYHVGWDTTHSDDINAYWAVRNMIKKISAEPSAS